MLIKELTLRQFRNYEELTVSFEPGLNFIIGPNGSGKTNLAEAIYYLGLARSFKKCSESDLIRRSTDKAEISVGFTQMAGEEKGEHLIGAVLGKNAKAFYLDGAKVPQLSRILGRLAVIGFDPGAVFMFREDPAERRRFLDETLGSLSKGYLYTLGRYKKILRERNYALNRQELDDDVLRVLTDELITDDYIIAKQRKGLIERLDAKAQKIFADLEPGRHLSVSYITGLPPAVDQEEFRTAVKSLFESGRSEERIKKFTLIGVHRDDLGATIDGEDLGSYCSQGQNRLATFALKLAVFELMSELRGEPPILILDDVLSDLDESRCQKIIKYLEGRAQTLVTLADASKIRLSEKYTLYEIETNSVIRRD